MDVMDVMGFSYSLSIEMHERFALKTAPQLGYLGYKTCLVLPRIANDERATATRYLHQDSA